MKILLLGKFPPLQGGISSRYFWLYNALKKKYDFDYHVITVLKEPFVTPIDAVPRSVHALPVNDPQTPWFIPKCDLLTDRIANEALRIIETKKVDLIECNYLEPFLTPAALISQLCKIPLIVRPAGSDYEKFLQHPGHATLINKLLQSASRILLPAERIDHFLQNFPEIPGNHIVETPRYIPDPHYFHATPHQKEKQILLAGKINQFWRLRNIDLLIQFLRNHQAYRLHCIVDGSHIDEFSKFLFSNIPEQRVTMEKGFINPLQMPSAISHSYAVWNVLLPGGIPDFPNLHLEALFAQRISIVSKYVLGLPDMSKTPEALNKYVKDINKILQNEDTFFFQSRSDPISDKECNNIFDGYLTFHYNTYINSL